MFKVKDDYEGMIMAAVNATQSSDIAKIIKYIQANYTVPTNFEKHVRQKWSRLSKRKMDLLYNSPPKPINKVSKNAPPIPGLNMNQDLYLPNEIIHQIFKFLEHQDLLKFREVCTQWRDVAMDKGFRREVRLSSAIFLPISFLRSVLRSASVIQVLDLSGSSLTDHLVSLLAQKPPGAFKRLHTLSIAKCVLLSPTGCYNLFKALSATPRPSTASSSSSSLTPLPSLTSLNVAECKIDDSIVNQFISKFTNLTFLDISRIWTISMDAVFNITRNCTKLQKVNMVNLTFIFDSAIASLAENCKNLSHVDMSCCYGLTSSTLSHLNAHPLQYLSIRSISVNSNFTLPSTLRHLDMSKCTGITDEYLIPIIKSCKQLETLNLSECPDLTDSSLDVLSNLRNSLVSLNISGCLAFTPEGVETIVPQLTRLNQLSIAHLNLTDSFFTQNISSLKNLKTLDISHNTKVTDKGVEGISKGCNKLQVFICEGLQTGNGPASLRKCGVTAESLSYLKKNCPYLRVLSMKDTLTKDVHKTLLNGLKKGCPYLEQVTIGDDKITYK